MNYTPKQFITLETKVWEALKTGSAEADAKLLTDNFIGIYETGFSDKSTHCSQLNNGPIVLTYELSEERIVVLANGLVLLAYLAKFTKLPSKTMQKMYISSIWQEIAGEWKNIFSQDTPVVS